MLLIGYHPNFLETCKKAFFRDMVQKIIILFKSIICHFYNLALKNKTAIFEPLLRVKIYERLIF